MKSRTNSLNINSSPTIGLLGGAVSVNNCTSQDNSFYCNFSRIYSIIIKSVTLLLILYCFYILFKNRN